MSGGEPAVGTVSVASELYRLALYVSRVAPNLQMDVPATSGALGTSLTVAQTLERLRTTVERQDAQLASSRLSQPSRLLGHINLDLLVEILSYLDGERELMAIKATCSGLRRLVLGSDALWQSIVQTTFPYWYDKYMNSTRTRNIKPPPGVAKWHSVFQNKVQTDRQWFVNKDRKATHSTSLARGLHCIYFDENELYCGSGVNNEIIVLDLKTGKRRNTNGLHGLVGHTQAVSAVQPLDLDPNLLISSSLDHTMRLWDRTLMHPRMVYEGHTEKVWCVQVSGTRVFSGGSDKTIKIWDVESAKTLATLKDHRTSISALKLMKHSSGANGVTLVTGSAGNTIRVWNISQSSAICTTKLRGHEKGVFSLHCTPSLLLSGSLDNTIKIWDPRQNYRYINCLQEPAPGSAEATNMTEDKMGIITFCCDDTKVVSGGPETVIKLWDLRMFRFVDKFEGHTHWVTSLQFDDDKIVSASRDRTIRFWDVSGRMQDSIALPASPPE